MLFVAGPMIDLEVSTGAACEGEGFKKNGNYDTATKSLSLHHQNKLISLLFLAK